MDACEIKANRMIEEGLIDTNSAYVDSLIIEEFSDPDQLKDEWLSLEANTSGFQSFFYVCLWFKNISTDKGYQPLILKISDQQGNCLMIIPWVIRRKAGFKIAGWCGDRQGAYRGALFDKVFLQRLNKGNNFDQLWKRLRNAAKEADVIALYEQPEEVAGFPNPFLRVCGSLYSHNKTSTALMGERSFEEFDQKCGSAKSRSKERRSERQIAKQASFAIEIAETREHRLDLFEQLKSQKSAWFKKNKLSNFFTDEKTEKFIRQTCLLEKSDSNPVYSIIAALRTDDEILAVNLALVSHGTAHGMIASIGESTLNRYSPGVLLIKNILSWCMLNDVKKFDFGAGANGLYDRWVSEVSPLHSCITPLNAKGGGIAPVLRWIQRSKNYLKKNKSLHAKALRGSQYLKRKIRVS